MAKFYVTWQCNPQMLPLEPEERAKLLTSLLEMVREDMKAGKLTDWGVIAGGMSGYTITGDVSEAEFHASTYKWMPYVDFDAHPMLTAEQLAELNKKAFASVRAK